MGYKVDNAVIMAAGTSSRFAPLSYEKPKALFEVKGEVLIERQIRQLYEAGVPEVIVVTGYKHEQFAYLAGKLGVRLVYNPEYLTRNNTGSIHAVRDLMGSTYLCSADNYFAVNPFESEVEDSYYAAEYADGPTEEWCMQADGSGRICQVQIGGRDAWYMMGHTFWSRDFTRKFLALLEAEYDEPETAARLWESFFIRHLDQLDMTIRKYPPGHIYEFDSLDDLRAFDESYVADARSPILADTAARLGCAQGDIRSIRALTGGTAEAEGFAFTAPDGQYKYIYKTKRIERI